nr:MAG TPA: hypothetical protein [Caudoviricetes sp.]
MKEYKIYFRGSLLGSKLTHIVEANNAQEALEEFYRTYNKQCEVYKVKDVTPMSDYKRGLLDGVTSGVVSTACLIFILALVYFLIIF